jgi:hypothetical protein
VSKFSDLLWDLNQGAEVKACLRQLLEHLKEIELRVGRLEAVMQADRQNVQEVDSSVRQTWQVLDERIKRLEESWKG